MSDMITGILKHTEKGAGMLRDPEQSLLPGPDDVFVPAKMVQEHGLPEGARVTGPVRRGSRGPLLTSVEQVCGLTPEVFRQRTPFTRLTPIDPHQRFELSSTGEIGMRVVDLAAPIGRGTRGRLSRRPRRARPCCWSRLGPLSMRPTPEHA
jgi:transcription termination factor Rho